GSSPSRRSSASPPAGPPPASRSTTASTTRASTCRARSPSSSAWRASNVAVELAIAAAKALFSVLLALQVMGLGVFFERKVSALIQDRIGANRASIFGVAALGLINTLVADPVKFLLKEDVVPAGTDRLLHFLAPCLAVIPVLVTFAVVPFGDVLQVAGRTINLQAAELNVGI